MELFSGHSVVSAKYVYKFENVFLGIYMIFSFSIVAL